MNLKQNFSDKIRNFSTRLCIRFTIRYHTDRINYLFQNNRLYISSLVQICRATLLRRRPAFPDPKQDPDSESDPELEPKLPLKLDPDPESDPKQIIPDPQPWLLDMVIW